MKHIIQKSNWDCTIASAAMFLKLSYKEVRLAYDNLYPLHEENGLTDKEMYKLLEYFGVNPFTLNDIHAGVRGIMDLPSLNDDGGFHAVFFDGHKIYDPNYQVKGKKYYSPVIRKFIDEEAVITVDLNDAFSLQVVEAFVAKQSEKKQRNRK